tara:strand:+ start:441 stop:638 length:198 start_codon:yes stop_codon:yes gene_type:complete
MLVAVIDKNIVATTGADLNHFDRNILKSDFIMFYTISDKPTYYASTNKNSAGKLQRIKIFKPEDL